MEWQKLDLAQASLIKKEVDAVLQRLNDFAAAASGNDAEINNARQFFITAIQARIMELENFYLSNSDDERAILFEKERLRLRKSIQPFMNITNKENRPHIPPTDNTISSSSIPKTSGQSVSTHMKSIKSMNNSIANKSTLSAAGSKKASTIYAWEDRSDKYIRQEFILDPFAYEPSSTPGFYSRKLNEEEEPPSSDKFIDFQIILSHEEMIALAARKKAERADVKLVKNQAATTSINYSTPYIDQKRIMKEMLRGQPDKWMASESMKR